MQSKKNKKEGLGLLFGVDGIMVIDDVEKVELFNFCFVFDFLLRRNI